MPVSIVIVGAGPSGFYAAQSLIARGLDCHIDILDTLPTPFGLIRGGVAPDHQHTKRVSRTYEETAQHEGVNFYGNVQLGRDISVLELRSLYDVVILAIGTPLDRGLDLIGGRKRGVYGAAEFVGWYNGHPACSDLAPLLDRKEIAVIGNGNVALDIGRLLVRTREEMNVTDMPDYAIEAIQNSPITDVYIFGRRGPAEAKFTNVELREIGRLENCVPMVDPEEMPDEIDPNLSDRDRRLVERNIATFRSFAETDPKGKGKRLHFCFRSMPMEILGVDRVDGLRLQRTQVVDGQASGTGNYYDIPCGAVIAAIGYRMGPIEGVPIDLRRGHVISAGGWVADGLYAVGWAKRGPSGVISTNKPDGDIIAERIEKEILSASKPGRPAFEIHLQARGVRWFSFEDWKVLDENERATARDGAPRRKLVDIDDMISVLDQSQGAASSTPE